MVHRTMSAKQNTMAQLPLHRCSTCFSNPYFSSRSYSPYLSSKLNYIFRTLVQGMRIIKSEGRLSKPTGFQRMHVWEFLLQFLWKCSLVSFKSLPLLQEIILRNILESHPGLLHISSTSTTENTGSSCKVTLVSIKSVQLLPGKKHWIFS